MKHEFTAIIERGEKFLIATCPEVSEAHGQGMTREECLRDLSDSIQSVLEYRRADCPEGTAELAGHSSTCFLPSLRDSTPVCVHPGVETPGYFQTSLRDESPAA